MPPTITAFWNKLNSNEKMVMYGAIIVVIAFLIGIAGSAGFGSASTDLIAAIAITVLYWLKYSPNKMNWPAPIQTIVLVIAGIATIFALLAALGALAFLFAFGLYGIAILVNAVGCVVMAWFAYKEYQAMPKASAPMPPAPPAPPAA
ncbi:MAG: hypothetical protein ABIZ52_06405 [Candidatus Limnocylindrales bacterium]